MHELRDAGPADAPALQRLYADIRGRAEWLPPAARMNADFAKESAGELVIVAVAPDGILDGLIAVWEQQTFVHHLYVRERARRRGVASALLESLRIRMPRPWSLKCLRSNFDALRFYRRLGWVSIAAGSSGDGVYELLQWPAAAAVAA
jgi:GNAT superfamily N-acetyltransferase